MKSHECFYDRQPGARWLALASICIAVFLIPQSMSSVNIALPAIADALQADAVLVSWIPAANLWGSIVLMLPAGRLADMIGRKRIYLVGVVGYALASLLVVVVNSVEMLLLVRVLQGLSSGLVFGTGMAIVATIFSDKNRCMALGFTATSVYLGLTCGPLIGGWLTEHVSWRGVFWAPVPLALVAIILVVIYVRDDHKPRSESSGQLDWPGSLLFILMVTALLYGLSNVTTLLGGLIFGVGCLLLIGFIKQQNRAEYPLIRINVLAKNRVFNRSLLASFFMYSGNYPILFLLSLYLQYLQGLSPSESGQLILIQALMMAILAPLAGKMSDRFEPRLIATAGCLLFFAGFAVLVFLDAESSLNLIILALVFLGVGFGLFSSPNNNAAMGSVAKDRLSIASALLNLARTAGNMFSMAIVVLLVNVMLGANQIEPQQYPQLLQVIRIGMVIACGYTLLAAYFSYTRGNVRKG